MIKFNERTQPAIGATVQKGNAFGTVMRHCSETKGCEVKITAARDHHQIDDIVIWNFAPEERP